MARKLDPVIVDALKAHGFGPDACWDCHGVWVVYHKVLEQIAASTGITFQPPTALEANGIAKSVALCVVGKLKDRVEWSIGEAAPGNNKNAYPYAMAEKRAKDRVILKLIGLHGLVYSEDEIDEPKAETKPIPVPFGADLDSKTVANDFIADMRTIKTIGGLKTWGATMRDGIAKLTDADAQRVRDEYGRIMRALSMESTERAAS